MSFHTKHKVWIKKKYEIKYSLKLEKYQKIKSYVFQVFFFWNFEIFKVDNNLTLDFSKSKRTSLTYSIFWRIKNLMPIFSYIFPLDYFNWNFQQHFLLFKDFFFLPHSLKSLLFYFMNLQWIQRSWNLGQ